MGRVGGGGKFKGFEGGFGFCRGFREGGERRKLEGRGEWEKKEERGGERGVISEIFYVGGR